MTTEIKKMGVDLYMLKNRYSEEVELLKKDMHNFLVYYMDIKLELEDIIKELLESKVCSFLCPA